MIIERNCIMSLFMGATREPSGDIGDDLENTYYDGIGRHGGYARNFDYHISWDSLMSVVQKILHLPLIKGKVMEQTHNMEIVVNGLMIADMCKIYFACIDFIKWYNSQHKQTNP